MPSITVTQSPPQGAVIDNKSLLQAHCVHKSSQVESTALLGAKVARLQGRRGRAQGRSRQEPEILGQRLNDTDEGSAG